LRESGSALGRPATTFDRVHVEALSRYPRTTRDPIEPRTTAFSVDPVMGSIDLGGSASLRCSVGSRESLVVDSIVVDRTFLA
jgi:hypothetical protein